jgi:hypothetical protein
MLHPVVSIAYANAGEQNYLGLTELQSAQDTAKDFSLIASMPLKNWCVPVLSISKSGDSVN